jgi:leukotriene-A4 hydrolase
VVRPWLSLLLALAAVSPAQAADPHSYADPDRFLVRHVALDLRADFEAHRLDGTAELTVEQRDPYAKELTLDTRDLEIRSVHLVEADGTTQVLAFRLGERAPVLGSKLTIDFPHCCEPTPTMRIRIDYRT